MILIVIILVLIILMIIFTRDDYAYKTKVRKCYSESCGHNINGKCNAGQIDVYDNGVIGLCLWHTSSMTERILDPFAKGKELGNKESQIKIVEKLQKEIDNEKDKKAIQDPEEFAKWMRGRGVDF